MKVELIDRNAVCKDCYVEALCEAEKGRERCVIKRTLEFQPVVDVVPVVHGYWIKNSGNSYTVKCSICKSERISSDSWFEYCPRCGAKMDGETNGIN